MNEKLRRINSLQNHLCAHTEHFMNIGDFPQKNEACLRWMVLDLNSYFASCEQQYNPLLRNIPIAVAPMLADTTCVIAASYEAKAFGIKTGTIVREAKILCPNIKIVQARPKLYVEYHHRILDAIETCIPIEDVMSIDEVACRLDKIQQNPNNARELSHNIKDAIRDRAGCCLTSSIGIASNRLLAKLASDMQKPDGLTILQPEDMPEAILRMKPNDICGIGPNMDARLRNSGITDMSKLWAADEQHLRRVWNGVNGLRFHALLHGADLPSPTRPRRSIGHQHVLPPEKRSLIAATPVIRQLLVRAAQRLRTEGFYCRRLILDIKWMQDLGHYVQQQRFQETQSTEKLLSILMPLWNAAPSFKPLRVGITLSEITTQSAHQPDLFDKTKPVALTSAIDKLNLKFGHDTVTYGSTDSFQTSKIAFQRVPDMGEL